MTKPTKVHVHQSTRLQVCPPQRLRTKEKQNLLITMRYGIKLLITKICSHQNILITMRQVEHTYQLITYQHPALRMIISQVCGNQVAFHFWVHRHQFDHTTISSYSIFFVIYLSITTNSKALPPIYTYWSMTMVQPHHSYVPTKQSLVTSGSNQRYRLVTMLSNHHN